MQGKLCSDADDYKALTLLLNKKDQDDFILGGKGFGVEFCAFCDAIRVIIQFSYILDLYFQYPSLGKKELDLKT